MSTLGVGLGKPRRPESGWAGVVPSPQYGMGTWEMLGGGWRVPGALVLVGTWFLRLLSQEIQPPHPSPEAKLSPL